MTYSLLASLMDVIAPRPCFCCGNRLSLSEQMICADCNFHLPRTEFGDDFTGNALVQRFVGQLDVQRAFALTHYDPHSRSADLIYRLKYGHVPQLGEEMGRLMASELAATAFFDGITAIVPVPLTPKRQRQRGYNQSMMLARGIAAATRLPILKKAVRRVLFTESQTNKTYRERLKNVENAFALADADALRGQHVLVVDDVVTTGATMSACGKQILLAGDVKVSVLSWGMAHGK